MEDYRSLLNPRMANVVQDASFLRRAGAFLVDILLLDMVVTAPFTTILQNLATRAERVGFSALTYTGTELAAAVFLFLIIYLYFVLFEYLLGQTLGMMLMNTRVIGRNSIWSALARNSFLLPVFPFIVFWIVEPVAILFWRRGVLEQLSQTRTIHQQTIVI